MFTEGKTRCTLMKWMENFKGMGLSDLLKDKIIIRVPKNITSPQKGAAWVWISCVEGLLQRAAAWQGSGCRLASGGPVEFRYSDSQIIAENSAEQQTSFDISFVTLRRYFSACNVELHSYKSQLKSLTSPTDGKVSKKVKSQTRALVNMATSSALPFGLMTNAVNATANVA